MFKSTSVGNKHSSPYMIKSAKCVPLGERVQLPSIFLPVISAGRVAEGAGLAQDPQLFTFTHVRIRSQLSFPPQVRFIQ